MGFGGRGWGAREKNGFKGGATPKKMKKKRLVTTRSGRAIIRRPEIDFSLF